MSLNNAKQSTGVHGHHPTDKQATDYTQTEAARKELPLDMKDAVIYFVGPTPAKPGEVIGSAGPTTSYRMDAYSPRLFDLGVKCVIGKGDRNDEVCRAIERNGAVYLCAIGGAGALAAASITECEVIAFPELGPESVKKLTFRDFPLICAIDASGGNLFKSR